MRILAIGDLHGKIPKVPKKNIDLILLTGDLGKSDIMRKQAFKKIESPNYKPSNKAVKRGYMQAYNSTLKALKRLRKIAPIYLVYGNVENSDYETRKLSKEIKLKLPLLGKKIRKLKNVENISERIKSLKEISITGYSHFIEKEWIKRFKGNDKKSLKKHKKEDENARKFFRKLNYVDILLVHQPPYKILDKAGKMAPKKWRNKHAGSEIILAYIKRKHPEYVICGHIHEAFGERKLGKTKIINLGEGKFKLLEL